jgi:PRTRC genetic system protein C
MADEVTTETPVAETQTEKPKVDTSKYPREFAYGSTNIADPDPLWGTEKVVQHFAANGYPEMTTATVDGPKVVGKKNVYTISRKTPTKG